MFDEMGRSAAERKAIVAIQTLVTAKDEAKLQSEINKFVYGVVVGDLWGYISFVNEAAIKMMGATGGGEFIGKHVLNFLPQGNRGKETAEALKAIAQSQDRKGIYRVLSKNGKQLELEVKIYLMLDSQGERIGFVDLIKDITATNKEKA